MFIYGFCFITDQTFGVVTLGRLFPSSVQSSIEGVRKVLGLSDSFVASLASAYIFENFKYVGLASFAFLLGLFMMLIIRRKLLQNPYIRLVDSE